ncbi:MAG: COX15/CtaA family protein [Gemmatimonadota bacterium]|nr:COX15/CtaA family protein [Gemmatimonadota bacterium]MDH3422916.1 COX15/CtaA family protein [Gemmatimonadota bacterium]
MLHPRAFKVTVVWTLLLLFLGSVVHATESSLACPDWPTCFGTMVPEMSGGVFWEHLHRLVAGGLVLMFSLATWLVHKEVRDRPWILKACWAGIALLLVQSAFGGLTVIYRLPDLVSTTHLALAFGFLGLATYLAAATTSRVEPHGSDADAGIRLWAWAAAGLVFAQSVLGGLVRHMDAGMACPDAPLCLGQVVPPLINAPIITHFAHRVLALVVVLAVLGLVVRVWRGHASAPLKHWAAAAGILVLVQVALGVASVLSVLAVAPVSLHTLVAAGLLASLVYLSGLTSPTPLGEPKAMAATAA